MSVASGLEAAFEFESNVLDSTSHAHNGTEAGGPTYAAGKTGNAIVVTSGSRASISPIIDAQPVAADPFSIEVWIKPSVLPVAYGTILANVGGGVGLYLRSGGLLSYWDFTAGSDHLSTSAIGTGAYVHVVFTYAGASGNWKFYINNVLSGSGAGAALHADDLACIGADSVVGERPFEGQIDMLRVWAAKELSVSDVSFLWNAGAGRTYSQLRLLGGLISWFGFDNNVLDLHGPNNGTAYTVSYTTGHTNQALTGNGTTSWVDLGLGTGLNFPGDMTIGGWVYRTGSTTQFITCRTSGSGGVSSNYELRVESGGNVNFLLYSGGGGASGGFVPFGVWTFVTAVRKGLQHRLYLDGLLVGTGTITTPTSLPAQNTLIGVRQDSSSTNLWLGQGGFAIDELSYFDIALTDEEVRDLWSSPSYPPTPVPFSPFVVGDASVGIDLFDVFYDIPFDNMFVQIPTVISYSFETDYPSRGAVTEAFGMIPAPAGGGPAPAITAMTPTVMTTVARNQVHSFDFTDTDGFTTIIVAVGYPSGRWDLVYNGASFMPQYAGSTITPIADGCHLDIVKTGGWAELGTLNMFVEGVDTTGAENV